MRTIYVVIATKQYDTSPKVLRAFGSESEAQALKEIIDACSPSRSVDIQPVQLVDDRPQPTAIGVFLSAMEEAVKKADDGGPVKGMPYNGDPPEAFVPENPDGPTAA